MVEDWVKNRIDQHTDQIKGLQTSEGIIKHRVRNTEHQYQHLHSCLHALRGETRSGFDSVNHAIHELEGRLKDQLHQADSKWQERLVKVEAKNVEVISGATQSNQRSKKDESLVTLRDAIWFLVAVASIIATAFVK